MNRLALAVGGVAALALVAVIGIGLVSGGGLLGPGATPAPTPSSEPTAEATPDPASESVAYSSDRHFYSLRIPAGWRVNEIPGSWQPGGIFNYMGAGSDQFVDPTEPAWAELDRFMNSQPVSADLTFEQWVGEVELVHNAFFTNCSKLSSEDSTLVGEPALIETADCDDTDHTTVTDAAAALVMHDGRGYWFRVLSEGTADEKALLLEWLATLQFTDVAATP